MELQYCCVLFLFFFDNIVCDYDVNKFYIWVKLVDTIDRGNWQFLNLLLVTDYGLVTYLTIQGYLRFRLRNFGKEILVGKQFWNLIVLAMLLLGNLLEQCDIIRGSVGQCCGQLLYLVCMGYFDGRPFQI
eukprot:TRINITY_DN8934_c0_g1_i6.p4 TRINITY_DN8934_c0_g1~~TRINITY_DN8934_c0_g1_i6.p4  ORF type:complete len:130 (-),score=5.28 TRINITY_DN8934_c0_g1_i6:66-455(-)